jgi:hypothetical protein
MRWIVCLLLASMWLVSLFTGLALPDHPNLPLLGIAGLVLLPRARRRAHPNADVLPTPAVLGH